MDSQFVVTASGPDYEGYAVIDSMVENRSSGGVRIAHDLTLEEVRDLAREMSFKYSLFGLSRGGAKAGIRIPGEVSPVRRGEILEGFGRQIAPLIRLGLYYPGMDLNCGPEDLVRIYHGAGLALPTPTDSSFFTALSVAAALEASASALALVPPVRLSIAGYGRVAHHLVSILPGERFRVVALSTVLGGAAAEEGFDRQALITARDAAGDALVHRLGGRTLPREEVLREPTDVLLPAARTRALGADAPDRIRARAILPVANAPFAPGVADAFFARGTLCLPGYVVNCGGVLGSSLFDSGLDVPGVRRFFDGHFREFITALLETARRLRVSPVALAEELARAELDRRSTGPVGRALPAEVRSRVLRKLPRAARRTLLQRRLVRNLENLKADLERRPSL